MLVPLVDGQVIAIVDLCHKGTRRIFVRWRPLFCLRIMEAGNDVGNVIVGREIALIVQREAVGGHIIEPHIVCTTMAGLGVKINTAVDTPA